MVQKVIALFFYFFFTFINLNALDLNISSYSKDDKKFDIILDRNALNDFYLINSPLKTPYKVVNFSSNKIYVFQEDVLISGLNLNQKIITHKNTILYSVSKFPSSLLDIILMDTTLANKNFQAKQNLILDNRNIKPNQVKFKNRYLIGIICFLIILILLRNINPLFFKNLFNYKFDSNILLERSSAKINYYQGENIFFIVLSSMLFALLSSIYTDQIAKYFNRIFFIKYNFNSEYLFLIVFMFFMLIFILRWMHNYFVSLLFGLTNLSKILSNEFSRSVLQVTFVFFPIILIVNNPYKSPDYLNINFVLFFWFLIICIFAVKELYYFYKLFNFKKIYIIAYICICDLFPTSVLLKFLTKIEFL